MARIIRSFPGIPLELVAVYCPSPSAVGRFYDVFDVPMELRPFFSVIEVPQGYIDSRKQVYNITYFPEFDLKNIGIRRARGEYILTANADCIPPIGFFHSVSKRAFSPLSYIRSRRFMIAVEPGYDLLDIWATRPHTAQRFANVCQDNRYYDHYERDGCGDFQGVHRELWFAVHGFLESKHVFHVDAGISLDFSAVPAQMFVRVIGENLHLQHPVESKATSHFKFWDESIKIAIRQGRMTHLLKEYARPHWGAEGVEFARY
jgi:hypothetical protein